MRFFNLLPTTTYLVSDVYCGIVDKILEICCIQPPQLIDQFAYGMNVILICTLNFIYVTY